MNNRFRYAGTSRSLLLVALVLLAANFLCAKTPPKLIVFVSIDQMRSEYLDRYAAEYTSGLKRLATEGLFFTNADLNYAASETGPGHTSLSTGAYPARNGIVENHWRDRTTKKTVYCVDDDAALPVEGEGGRYSPHFVLVSAIGDWLKSASPASKVVSTSSKNRAAILMGGQHPNYVFWYEKKTGHMVTSSYYTQQLPAWVKTFNTNDWTKRNLPPVWSKLLPDSVYAATGPDELKGETLWDGKSSFPHTFRLDKRYEQLADSPFQDQMVLDFARAAIQGENLGKRNATDLLCISLSATDIVGHNFGPDSHEQHDNLLRLDLALGAFLADLEFWFGRENLLVVLSADHGCISLPEYQTDVQHKFGRRIKMEKEITPRIAELNKKLGEELKTSELLILTGGFLNYTAAQKAGMPASTFEKKVREGLLAIDGIADVYFRSELMNSTTADRPYLQKFRNSYFPERGEDYKVRYSENTIATHEETGAEHGSPYSYDTRIPIVFWGPRFSVKRSGAPAATIDIAPTLAKMLDIQYPNTVDGKPLVEVLK